MKKLHAVQESPFPYSTPSSPCTHNHKEEECREQFKAHVIIAEDSPVNQKVVRLMVENFGCRVDVAANGIEAIEALSHTSYDLVFMDCHMPEMDGFEATKAIREKEELANAEHGNSKPFHIPIIALTADAVKGSRDQCLAAGMDDYLAKPFNKKQLYSILKTWLPQQCFRTEMSRTGQGETVRFFDSVQAQPFPESCTLDVKTLDSIRALQRLGKPDILEKVIDLYFSETPKLLQVMREAVAKGDTEGLRKSAHTLKSSSANIGAQALAALCKELEEMGRINSIENAATVFSEVESEYKKVCAALTRELQMRTRC